MCAPVPHTLCTGQPLCALCAAKRQHTSATGDNVCMPVWVLAWQQFLTASGIGSFGALLTTVVM
jgi:hypothetical protein